MQPIGSCQDTRVIGRLLRGQLGEYKRTFGASALMSGNLGQTQQCLGIVIVPPRPFALGNCREVFPVTGCHRNVDVESERARRVRAVPKLVVQFPGIGQSARVKESPCLRILEFGAPSDQIRVGVEEFDYLGVLKKRPAAQTSHQLLQIRNGPVLRYQVLEEW